MTMYFSEILIPYSCLKPSLRDKLRHSDAYAYHQLIWQFFEKAPDASRDFLFRDMSTDDTLAFDVLSKRPPFPLEVKSFLIETKEYNPEIYSEQVFNFSLRVNPVVTHKVGDTRKRQRHDVVMMIKHQQRTEKQSPPLTENEIITQAGLQWLTARTEKLGFDIRPDNLVIDGYRQHNLIKPKSSTPIRYSTLDYSGTLIVKSPVRFKKSLYNGIGRSKAFGCGLLLIKPE